MLKMKQASLAKRIWKFLLVVLLAGSAQAQDMQVDTRQAWVLPAGPSSLNGSQQETLAVTVRGQAVNGVITLLRGNVVTVLNRSSFVKKQTLQLAGDPMPKDVKRSFQAAYVEVKDGPDKGKKGWTILSYTDPDSSGTEYFVPANVKVQRAEPATTTGGVDLWITVNDGANSPTGGRLYHISVANKGTVDLKGDVEIVTELNGQPLKTEKVRGPLKAGQGASFSVTVGDKDVRKGFQLSAKVSPKSVTGDVNPGNDTATKTVAPYEGPSTKTGSPYP